MVPKEANHQFLHPLKVSRWHQLPEVFTTDALSGEPLRSRSQEQPGLFVQAAWPGA